MTLWDNTNESKPLTLEDLQRAWEARDVPREFGPMFLSFSEFRFLVESAEEQGLPRDHYLNPAHKIIISPEAWRWYLTRLDNPGTLLT